MRRRAGIRQVALVIPVQCGRQVPAAGGSAGLWLERAALSRDAVWTLRPGLAGSKGDGEGRGLSWARARGRQCGVPLGERGSFLRRQGVWGEPGLCFSGGAA